MSIRSNINKYFEDHPNEKVYLGDIAGELSLTDQQTQSAIYQLRKDGLELEVVHQGQCWIYKPVAEAETEYMTVLNTTTKGSKILQDSEGTIWIAKKVDD